MTRDGITLEGLKRINGRSGASLPLEGEQSVEAAWSQLNGGNWDVPVDTFVRRGSSVYRPRSKVDRLLEKAANRVLVSCLEVRHSNRDQIVSNLVELLRESSPLRIYRFDVAAFYESIDRVALLSKLRERWEVPRSTLTVVESVFRFCQEKGVEGLPRGLALSATLAESHLRLFDESVRGYSTSYYYARFVDDIIFVTTAEEEKPEFIKYVGNMLRVHAGLKLNKSKQSSSSFCNTRDSIEYLGYRFSAKKQRSRRIVDVDVAESKARRIKTKICLALLDYCCRRRNFTLLRERICLLAGNYRTKRRSEHEALRVGIYYSYKEVSGEMEIIRNLDTFLRVVLFGNRMPISSIVKEAIPKPERSELSKISFLSGHTMRRMRGYSYEQFQEIQECWLHV